MTKGQTFDRTYEGLKPQALGILQGFTEPLLTVPMRV